MANEDISNVVAVDTDKRANDVKAAEHGGKMEELKLGKNKLKSKNAKIMAAMLMQVETLKASIRKHDDLILKEQKKLNKERVSAERDEEETQVSRLKRKPNVAKDSSAQVKILKNSLSENEKKNENLERTVEFLKGLVAKNVAENESLKTQWKTHVKKLVESRLNEIEKRVRLIEESRMDELEKRVRLIEEALNGNKGRIGGEAKALNGLKSVWPLLTVGSGTVAVATAVYIFAWPNKDKILRG